MLSMHDREDLDGLAKMADRLHENDSRVSRTAASSAGHFSHVTKTPTTSLSLDSVSDKLNDLSVCVERLNATVSRGGQYRVQKYRGTFLVPLPVPTVLFQKWYRSTGTAVLF